VESLGLGYPGLSITSPPCDSVAHENFKTTDITELRPQALSRGETRRSKRKETFILMSKGGGGARGGVRVT